MTKDERRQAMPMCAAFVDDMREAFPKMTVQNASENGVTWGEKRPVIYCEQGTYVTKSGLDPVITFIGIRE